MPEARWVARYRRRALGGDLVAAGIGVSLALVVRFGAQIGVEYLLLGCVLPITWMVRLVERGDEPRYFGTCSMEELLDPASCRLHDRGGGDRRTRSRPTPPVAS